MYLANLKQKSDYIIKRIQHVQQEFQPYTKIYVKFD